MCVVVRWENWKSELRGSIQSPKLISSCLLGECGFDYLVSESIWKRHIFRRICYSDKCSHKRNTKWCQNHCCNVYKTWSLVPIQKYHFLKHSTLWKWSLRVLRQLVSFVRRRRCSFCRILSSVFTLSSFKDYSNWKYLMSTGNRHHCFCSHAKHWELCGGRNGTHIAWILVIVC